MDKSLELFVKLVRESTRFVNRDFFELESMQSVAKKNRQFAENTCIRVAECYREFMSKYFPNLVFTADSLDSNKIDKEVILIEILDGFDNLAKSLPYFASVATKLIKKADKLVADQSVMIMYGCNKIYYTMSGVGAWKEDLYGSSEGKSRLRVASANVKNMDRLVIGTSHANLQTALKFSENVRIFGSDAYLCAMLACGKLDIAVLSKNDLTTPAYKLFIKESGGVIIESGDVLIATNADMQSSVNKHL